MAEPIQRSFLVVTRQCVNECLFCTEIDRKGWPEPTTEEIKEILTSQCRSFPNIVFSGGEPTLRKEIFELVKFAKNLGYYTNLFTNGRLFSNPEIAEKALRAGLDNAVVPLHGHTPEIHDRITQRLGSFSQTLSGIKNLASRNVSITIKVIPNKVNFQNLPQFASFVTSVPHNAVAMDMLVIAGNALKNKDIISTKLSEMVPYIEAAIDVFVGNGENLSVSSLPFCLVRPKYWRRISNDRIMDEISMMTVWDKKSPLISSPGLVLTDVCRNCLVKNKCPGIWAAYFRAYGDGELKPIL